MSPEASQRHRSPVWYIRLRWTASGTYFAEVAEELGPDDRTRDIVTTLQNGFAEIYNVMHRRKNIIDLRSRVNFDRLESTAEDVALLEQLEERCKGLSDGFGDMATADPLIRKWALEFAKRVKSATFTAAAKQAGTAKAARRKDTQAKGKGKTGYKAGPTSKGKGTATPAKTAGA